MALGIEIEYSREVVEKIASARETEKYGARPIRRRVTDLIENELARMIISSGIKKGEKIKIDVSGEKIVFSGGVTVADVK